MATKDQTLLGYALLGLIRLRQPCSGYDLRGFFAGRPMATFSDSPGSIYPALKRLERSQLISGVLEETSRVRRRKLYHLSAKGKKTLERWLSRRIRPDDVVRGMPELFLRFAYLEECLGTSACAPFLNALASAVAGQISFLHDHFNTHQSEMSRSARLALRSGIMVYECQAAWAKMAIEEYQKPPSRA